MKITKTLVYALALCLSLVSVAEAKGRSGSSFKGGFSSQRQKAPTPAPSYQAPSYQAPAPKPSTKPSFGGFGSNKTSTQAQAANNQNPSQMSRDLDKRNAQANAQKAWDARNKPQVTDSQPVNAGKSDSGWFGNGNTNQRAQTPPPAYSQPGYSRAERSGGGFWNGVMWFMLGNSLAHNSNAAHANQAASAPAATTQAAAPVDGSMDLGPADNAQAVTNAQAVEAPQATETSVTETPQAAEPEPESALVSLLRAILWTIVIVAVFWLVRGFMRLRNRANNRRNNYSLGN